MDFSLEQLQSFLETVNYITLIEKLHKSELALKKGCPNCTGYKQAVPVDHFSIIAGDPSFPLNKKLNHL